MGVSFSIWEFVHVEENGDAYYWIRHRVGNSVVIQNRESDSAPLIFESDSRRLHFLPRLSTEQIKKITGREKGNAGQNQDAAFSMVVKAAEAKELTMAKIVDDPPNCSRR